MYAAQRTNGDFAAMKHRNLIVAGLLLLILGCGNAIEDGLPAGRKLTRLQQGCPGFDEQRLENKIAIWRLARADGVSAFQAFANCNQGCQDDVPDFLDGFDLSLLALAQVVEVCVNCCLALTEYVYD